MSMTTWPVARGFLRSGAYSYDTILFSIIAGRQGMAGAFERAMWL